MPKLTIITINLNNISGLRETIKSVIGQTFEDYEYIIIDGGSKDGSVEVIKEHADNMAYWVSEPDKGIYNAMNKGILQAKGEYLQFLNSGDCFVDETILFEVFREQRSADILYGHLNAVYAKGTMQLPAVNESRLSLAYFVNNSIMHPSSFIARRLFKDSMYDEGYIIAADKLFFIENIILKNCTAQSIDIAIANFNTMGISNNPKSALILKEENDRVFAQTVPPRIAKDYEKIMTIWNSSLFAFFVYLQRFELLYLFLRRFTLPRLIKYSRKKIAKIKVRTKARTSVRILK